MIEKLKAWCDSVPYFRCQLREEVGLYCPGCGGTRSVLSLLQGNVWESIKYNPIVVYAAIMIIIFIILKVKKKLTIVGESKYFMYSSIVGFLLVVVRTIILNYYVIVKGIHLI